jgi:hypothetical protein
MTGITPGKNARGEVTSSSSAVVAPLHRVVVEWPEA